MEHACRLNETQTDNGEAPVVEQTLTNGCLICSSDRYQCPCNTITNNQRHLISIPSFFSRRTKPLTQQQYKRDHDLNYLRNSPILLRIGIQFLIFELKQCSVPFQKFNYLLYASCIMQHATFFLLSFNRLICNF